LIPHRKKDIMTNAPHWKIDHQCPQCAAPVILDEADRIMTCPYCRTKLYLVQAGGFDYYIPPGKMNGREIYYLPYWRIKGSFFCFRDRQIQFRFIDVSQKAVPIPMIPQSLGLRPQAMKLRFLTPEVTGIFLAPQEYALDALLPPGELTGPDRTDFIGEIISLIYAPVYLKEKVLFDAVTQRPLSNVNNPDLLDNLPQTAPIKHAKICFIPILCPQCGWNLEGEKDALSLGCNNCHTLWQCRQGRLEILACTIGASTRPADLYLPFWRMKIRVAGLAVETYGDLIRLANLPKVVTPEFESAPLYFWSPAFKINPAIYLRWTRLMTVSQPKVNQTRHADSVPIPALHPVTLPLMEAFEGIRINIGQLLSDKKSFLPVLAEANISLLESDLVYEPFMRRNSELIHATLGLSVDRNALSLAFHLS